MTRCYGPNILPILILIAYAQRYVKYLQIYVKHTLIYNQYKQNPTEGTTLTRIS